MTPDNVIPTLVSAALALGVLVLLLGLQRLRLRTTTSSRVAAFVERDVPSADPSRDAPARPRATLGVARAIRVLQSLDTKLRVPLIVLTLVCGFLGLATVTPGWLALAAASAAAVYALGARTRWRQRIEKQTLTAMQLLSSGLRAGYSVPQAIALVARHSPEPTASEFSLASQEIAIGVQLADSLAHLAERTSSADYALVVIIVRVQHEVGGNLALILDSVSNTLRERFELRGQVEALTAQQRLSSTVLTFLPFALLGFLFIMDRSFVAPLFTETIGRLLLATAGAMVFIGWSVMRSMGRVEV